MRTVKAQINWIDEHRVKRFVVSLLLPNGEEGAVLLPLALLSPDMKEGQNITIQVDDGDRDIDT